MSAGNLAVRWNAFLADFYSPPNALRADPRYPRLGEFLKLAESRISASEPGPVVLPAAISGTTYYFAIAFGRDQARNLRELLHSYVGTGWTDFRGQSLVTQASDELDRTAIAFAGEARFVYRLRVATNATEQAREAMLSLLRTIGSRPVRQRRFSVPIGRLIGDLIDACADGAEQQAAVAFDAISRDHRISEANRLFLRMQVMASFDRWEEVEALVRNTDVLYLPRSSAASDALAKLAMRQLGESVNPTAFAAVTTHFGGLVPSTTAIRSPDGARYYTLWALACDEPVGALAERMAAAGWGDDPVIADLLSSSPTAPPPTLSEAEVREHITRAIAAERYDAAVESLLTLTPAIEDLPTVLLAVSKTLSGPAITLLDRHRQAHGEHVLRQVQIEWAPPEATLIALPDQLERLLLAGLSRTERDQVADAITSTAVAMLRQVGAAEEAVARLTELAGQSEQLELDPGLDICIDLARDLKAAGCSASILKAWSLCVLELWALLDQSGDRHRANRIVHLVTDLFDAGLGIEQFRHVVELLEAGWEPFFTDTDLPLGVDLLELLVTSQPNADSSLSPFALPLLSRIGRHNIGRLPAAAVAVAVDLSATVGIELSVDIDEPMELTPGAAELTASVALYSLMEPALARAARVLRSRFPHVNVTTHSDHVLTESLKHSARNADLVVIMDRAATHAATIGIKEARGAKTIQYALGKGSTSLIEATVAALAALSLATQP